MKISQNYLKCGGLVAQISPNLILNVFAPTGEALIDRVNHCLRAYLITPFELEPDKLLFVWRGIDFFRPPYYAL